MGMSRCACVCVCVCLKDFRVRGVRHRLRDAGLSSGIYHLVIGLEVLSYVDPKLRFRIPKPTSHPLSPAHLREGRVLLHGRFYSP